MGTRNINRYSLQTLFALLAMASAVACGGDDSEKGPGQIVITTPDGGSVSKPIDAGAGSIDSGLGGDGSIVIGDSGPAVVVVTDPGLECAVNASGCYPCAAPKTAVAPTAATSARLLNTCSTGCFPFDNATRLQAAGFPASYTPKR
jgi:hypothetical protein